MGWSRLWHRAAMLDIGFILLGLVLLVLGGDFLVRGASGVALHAKVAPSVVGLTIVAAGTSMPEMLVSVQSALRGSPGLAVGNIVGSNIFNIGMIVGLAALIRPLRIQASTVRMEWPVMMGAAVLLLVLAYDGVLGFLEGLGLFLCLVAFTIAAVRMGRRDAVLNEELPAEELATASFGRQGGAALLLNSAVALVGIGLLAAGSSSLIEGAVNLAQKLGVSETVVGLTIVAAGTSTPELLTSLVASRRGQDDIAVANVVGSNIFNVLGIGGVTAMIHPLEVSGEIFARDLPWMLGFSLALFPIVKSGMKVTRLEGAALLLAFVVYMAILVRGAMV